MSTLAAGDKVYTKFFLGAEGISVGSISTGLEVDGASSSQTITITEDSKGWYKQEFQADVAGFWTEKITYGDFTFSFNWEVSGVATSSIHIGDTVRGRIYLGVTGLSLGDLSYNFELNNATTAVTPIMTEEGGGWYDISFTPNSNGFWSFWIQYNDDNIIMEAFVAPGVGSSSNTIVSVTRASNAKNVSLAYNVYGVRVR